MIRSIATRDKPGTSDQAAVDVLADVEMQFGDQRFRPAPIWT